MSQSPKGLVGVKIGKNGQHIKYASHSEVGSKVLKKKLENGRVYQLNPIHLTEILQQRKQHIKINKIMKDNKDNSNGSENDHSISVSENIIVIEKEFKNDSTHRDLINLENISFQRIKDLNELEFLTCGVEQCMKVWDKSLQTCDYTIETHKPLHTMAITGERNDIMIASITHDILLQYKISSDGDLIVFGLTNKNQLDINDTFIIQDIVENAHHATVIQIVSLQKLKNKYFATRCVLGNVNIWSATHHPDRLFTIENIDKDEPSYMHDQTMMNQTAKQQQDLNHQSSLDGGSSQINHTNTGLSASGRDRMIELRYKLQNQSSSTVLCFSNYNDQQIIIIAIVDLKTRRKNIIKTFKNQRQPTVLFQVDESNLLVESEQLIATFDAHSKSQEGISSIIQLNSNHYLLWGSQNELDKQKYKIVATASSGCSEFRLWLMNLDSDVSANSLTLQPHIRIETSLVGGIKYLLEASETQLVAVDTHHTLKFYEFIDKQKKEEEEKKAKDEEEMRKTWKDMLLKYDKDNSGFITTEEFIVMINDYFASTMSDYQYTIENTQCLKIDSDADGKLNRYELQSMINLFIQCNTFEKLKEFALEKLKLKEQQKQ